MKQVRYPSRALRGFCCAAIMALVASACGSDDDDSDSTPVADSTTASPDAAGTPDTAGTETPDSSGSDSPADSSPSDPFATPNQATGEPIKIGYATTGANEAQDYRHEQDATEAVLAYINEYLGGIGGRPLEVLTCEDGRAEARISTCINEMLGAKVPIVVTPSTTASAQYAKSFSEAGIPWLLANAIEPSTFATEGVYVLNHSLSSVSTAPARYMADNGLESIAFIAVDSPGLVDALTQLGEAEFGALGIDSEVLGVAPGTADMTPQVAAALQNSPDAVMVVGTSAFCIPAVTALRTSGYDGATLVPPDCIDDTTHERIPGGLEGVIQLGFRTTDPADPDVMLREAIYDKYAPGLVRDSLTDNASQVFLALHRVIGDMTGEITPETIKQAFAKMPPTPLPLGGGIEFQCNGKKVPELPAVCSNQGLSSVFNDEGQGEDFELIDLSATD